jgi:hypothetical protein
MTILCVRLSLSPTNNIWTNWKISEMRQQGHATERDLGAMILIP